MRSRYKLLAALTLAFCLIEAMPGYGQNPDSADQPPSSGWHKFNESRQAADQQEPPASASQLPSQLILPAGAWIAVRVNQPLSSDRNQPGQAFTATLVQPLVVDGLVIARRGQTIGGRVAEAQKAGRVKGTSRLGLELTEISLVDGQQLPVRTQLIEYGGGTSVGRDVAAVATTTGLGAAIGAAARGGYGAGVGAVAGAAASTIGVLVTRGRPTVVYPESVLTFRTMAPLAISTERSQQAFQPVTQEDYEPRPLQRRPGPPPTLGPPFPYYTGYYYPYSPFYYGPSFFFFSGPRFYHSRGFYRRW